MCYILKQFPDETKKKMFKKLLLNSWVRDKVRVNTNQMKLVIQGADHATEASHAIGASELDDGLGLVTLEEERVGASHAMGASELVVFFPELVAGSSVMLVRLFASKSEEEVSFGQEGVKAGQETANQGTQHDVGDPGGQVNARHGSHQDVVGAFSGAVGVRSHAVDAFGQGVSDCGCEAVGFQGLKGGEHGGTVQHC